MWQHLARLSHLFHHLQQRIRHSLEPQHYSRCRVLHQLLMEAQQFNAYPMYPNKAKLEINGDLDSMAQNWSEEEWEPKGGLCISDGHNLAAR